MCSDTRFLRDGCSSGSWYVLRPRTASGSPSCAGTRSTVPSWASPVGVSAGGCALWVDPPPAGCRSDGCTRANALGLNHKEDGISPDDLTCRSDAAAYALGALDRCEAEDFRRHLNHCIVYRDERGPFTEIPAALGLAAREQAMPSWARNRILRDIRAEGGPALPRSP